MDWKWFLFSFEGRVTRKPFWFFNVVLFVLYLIVRFVLTGKIDILHRDLISLIYAIIFLWPTLAIQTKRWHDRNKSGAWVFINGVPLIGAFWALVELGLLEGTVGDNRFGKDPIEGIKRRYSFTRELGWRQNCWAFGFLFLVLFFVLAWAVVQVFIKNR